MGRKAHVCHRSLQLWAARPTSAIVSAVGRGPTSAIDPYSRGPQAHVCHHLSHWPRAHVCHGSVQPWAAGPRLPLILTAAGRWAHVCRPLSRGPWAHVCPRSAGLARACKSTCTSACIRTYARAPVYACEGTPMLGIAGVQPWARGPRLPSAQPRDAGPTSAVDLLIRGARAAGPTHAHTQHARRAR